MTMNEQEIAEKIGALGLDEAVNDQLVQLTQGMDAEHVTPELLSTLARGITHDEDVQNADATGYLRGRNEKIETVLQPQPDQVDESQSAPVFPKYRRRCGPSLKRIGRRQAARFRRAEYGTICLTEIRRKDRHHENSPFGKRSRNENGKLP